MNIFNCVIELDEITLRLLIQTSKRTFGEMTEDQIHKQYIEQEKEKEWKSYKQKVIDNVVDRYAIEYGKGKFITATDDDIIDSSSKSKK